MPVPPIPSDVSVRRVGFRNGTDEELTALWTVEAPIEAERRPDVAPQSLEGYIAFARNLPSQFEDHTWIASTSDGEPIATCACWSNRAGDDRVMWCDVFVRRDRRRQGIARHLLATIADVTVDEGRSILTWSTFDAAPAGEPFSRSVGASVGRVNRTSELLLAAVDWEQVDAWVRAGRSTGYSLEAVDGPIPPALRADAAHFHHIMQTMPHDDLDIGTVTIDEEHVASVDQSLVESGREKWTLFVRAPDGACVGGTELTFEPWEPATSLQQNTGIDPEHRGLGLAKWAKAAMLDRLRVERPEVERVRTGNAFSNAPMLAINDALGFEVIAVQTEWQVDAAPLRARLSTD